MAKHDLTVFERMEIQMEYAVPLVRSLQKKFGEDAVLEALDARLRSDLEEAKKAQTPPGDLSNMEAGFSLYGAGNALEFDVVKADEEHFDANIKRCAYAELMERLGARDLGPSLICNHDFAMAERMGLELTRTQTRMQGASHCDFRYRKVKR